MVIDDDIIKDDAVGDKHRSTVECPQPGIQ